MRQKGKKRQWLCGLAALVLIVGLAAAWLVEKRFQEKQAQREAECEAQLRVSRHERPVPIYGAEEGEEVLTLLQEQANRNCIDAAEENENICVYYSLTGRTVHKEAFDRFLENVEQEKEDAVIVMESDWEGRVNVHFISYREGEFFYVLDSDDQYYNEEPLMRSFAYGEVCDNSIRLSSTEDEDELAAWEEDWLQEAEEIAEAFANQAISWEEYQVWQAERRERAKERPCVWVRVGEEDAR